MNSIAPTQEIQPAHPAPRGLAIPGRITLRDYQQRTLDMLWAWLEANDGNPCIVAPTGAGKSIIIAEICRHLVTEWPEVRVLMLTHVRELIEQNAAKLRAVWPNAPMGVYSAGLRRRELGEPITFAGIQSVRGKADLLGLVDIVIIDEVHLVSHNDEGGYRALLADLARANPALRVIGLTATPYRLGHGLITQGETRIFHDLLEPTSIEELILKGYLAPLRSKVSLVRGGERAAITKLGVQGVHRRGGEYIESELQAAVDQQALNAGVAGDIVAAAAADQPHNEGLARQHWLVFCAGVDHALHVRDELRALGVAAETITGQTPGAERARLLAEFKAGRVTALTNANVLTTGFDYPDIDLIAMLRPTMSTGLYIQMAGRGLRVKSHRTDCLVLDFAGNVERHGPITVPIPPQDRSKAKEGEAPIKACPQCGEVIYMSSRICPVCGYAAPPKDPEKDLALGRADIMGREANELEIVDWQWAVQTSQKGIPMLVCCVFGPGWNKSIRHYFCVEHDGYAGEKGRRELLRVAKQAGVRFATDREVTLKEAADALNRAPHPASVAWRRDGKYDRIVGWTWPDLEGGSMADEEAETAEVEQDWGAAF